MVIGNERNTTSRCTDSSICILNYVLCIYAELDLSSLVYLGNGKTVLTHHDCAITSNAVVTKALLVGANLQHYFTSRHNTCISTKQLETAQVQEVHRYRNSK